MAGLKNVLKQDECLMFRCPRRDYEQSAKRLGPTSRQNRKGPEDQWRSLLRSQWSS